MCDAAIVVAAPHVTRGYLFEAAGLLIFGFVSGVIPGSTTTLFESGLPYSSGCT